MSNKRKIIFLSIICLLLSGFDYAVICILAYTFIGAGGFILILKIFKALNDYSNDGDYML